MLPMLYIIAFTVLAFLAMGNLIRSLMTLGSQEMQRPAYPQSRRPRQVPHPELLDESGNLIREPLLVMKSISVDEARDRLNALYSEGSELASQDDPRNEV
ncbi:DUF2973 domain-containing protein [Leptolyngbya sp. FACHB-261]|uniref:DUF2973 domain-containing protein n=1 Tax=Leptolyngbya sp. FACHB-261 TaxID=2692806 RepID=UPI001687C575|nr:DUF2973 domain-containing protein [Leptolyngbya sp. FACHB-261]MBD2099347.1 DUF2973 domain-containing protein [Leptolyngbya sp. FACHB-261]